MPAESQTPLSTTVLNHIDDALGPAAQRYFGEGFKRTRYAISVSYQADSAEGFVQVMYQQNWSSKTTDKVRKPHLSTLDAVLISGQVSCALLRRRYPLSQPDCQQAWIRALEIKAGHLSYEDLAAVPLQAKLMSSAAADDSLFGYLTRLQVKLGEMVVELVIDHALSEQATVLTDTDHYFSDGYRQRQCQLQQLQFEPGQLTLTAQLSLQTGSALPADGVMGAYPRCLLAIELLTAFAQLAQALMYQMDNLSRDQTNNLWMRQVSLFCPYPIIPQRQHLAQLACQRTSLLPKKDEIWRLTTVVATLAGHPEFRLSAKLCHSLPHGVN